MHFKNTLLLIGLFCWPPLLLFGQQGFTYSVETDNFPNVTVDFNLRNPVKKSKQDFRLSENGAEINFDLEFKKTKIDSSANKNILFLVENLNQVKRNAFYKDVLLTAIPQIVNKGDKFNIAVFDRVRNSGKKTTFLLLPSYTDDVNKIKDAIEKIAPVNDQLSNNRSPDVYHALYEGLTTLNNKFSENRFLCLLSSAYNNKWSSHNSFLDSKNFAREHNIPVYSIQYFIPGGEAHTMSPLIKETYGEEIITKNSSKASESLVNFLKDALQKLSGQNYQLSYDSALEADGVLHQALLKIDGKEFDIEFTAPDPTLFSMLLGKYLPYSIVFLLLGVISFGGLGYKINQNKKIKEQQIHAIKNQQVEKDREIRETKEKLDQQINHTNQAKLREQQIKQKEKREKAEAAAVNEMHKLGELPKIVLHDGTNDTIFDMKKSQIQIGRAKNNELVIEDKTVSRKHATIYFQDQNYFIKDNNSTAGVIVNGRPISRPVVLRSNDIIQLGASKLTFVC